MKIILGWLILGAAVDKNKSSLFDVDFLGCGRILLKDLLNEGDSPWRKQVLLEDVSSGEVELVLELTLNKSDLLL